MLLEIRNFTQNKIDESFLRRAAQAALKTVFYNFKKGKEKDEKMEISLAVVGDGRMRKLNKMYRGKNRVTDVLSFADKSVLLYLEKAFHASVRKEETTKPEDFIKAPDGALRLGEIIICYPQAKKQAKLAGHSLKKEMTVLLVHGIIHLLGYDHEKGDLEAEEMENLEKKTLKKVGI